MTAFNEPTSPKKQKPNFCARKCPRRPPNWMRLRQEPVKRLVPFKICGCCTYSTRPSTRARVAIFSTCRRCQCAQSPVLDFCGSLVQTKAISTHSRTAPDCESPPAKTDIAGFLKLTQAKM